VAVNIKVIDRFDKDSAADSLGRSWAGWDETASDQENWDHNRGRHSFGPRVDGQKYATMSYRGRIRLVARLSGRSDQPNPNGTRNC
jgi:hypothetical protein